MLTKGIRQQSKENALIPLSPQLIVCFPCRCATAPVRIETISIDLLPIAMHWSNLLLWRRASKLVDMNFLTGLNRLPVLSHHPSHASFSWVKVYFQKIISSSFSWRMVWQRKSRQPQQLKIFGNFPQCWEIVISEPKAKIITKRLFRRKW